MYDIYVDISHPFTVLAVFFGLITEAFLHEKCMKARIFIFHWWTTNHSVPLATRNAIKGASTVMASVFVILLKMLLHLSEGAVLWLNPVASSVPKESLLQRTDCKLLLCARGLL